MNNTIAFNNLVEALQFHGAFNGVETPETVKSFLKYVETYVSLDTVAAIENGEFGVFGSLEEYYDYVADFASDEDLNCDDLLPEPKFPFANVWISVKA
ncbi:hypothetical protein pwc_6 [Weissella phage PWc]|nr:hypothetical protein pwc_6 [Weissella phage PWc]